MNQQESSNFKATSEGWYILKDTSVTPWYQGQNCVLRGVQ